MARKATGNPNGRPPFKPTAEERKTVEMMGAVGVPQASIAMCIRDGIDVKTLKEHFGPELKTALIKANAKVAGAMFNKAIKGDVGAGRFWLNCRAGWKETNVNEMTGNPVVNQFVFVPMGVDDEPNKD